MRATFITLCVLLAACGSSTGTINDGGSGGGGAATGGGGGTATGGGGGTTGGGGGTATGGGGGTSTGGGGGTPTGGGGGSTGGGGGTSALDGGSLNGGDTCATAPDVTEGGLFTGSTTQDAGANDDYGPAVGTCPGGGAASGRDVAYAITATTTTSYTVTVTPLIGTFDPLLYAQLACGTDTCVAGTTLNGPGQPETITFSAPAGQTVYVIVDGENVTRGPFEISIQK